MVRMFNLLEDMWSSCLLENITKSSYTRYFWVARFIKSKPYVFPLLLSLATHRQEKNIIHDSKIQSKISAVNVSNSLLKLIHLDDKTSLDCEKRIQNATKIISRPGFYLWKKLPGVRYLIRLWLTI